MTKYCKCGCGTEIADNRTYVHGHNRRNVKLSVVTREKMSKSANKKWEDPKEHEKLSKTTKEYYDDPVAHEKAKKASAKRWEDPKEHEKASSAANRRYEDPLEHEKSSRAQTKRFEENPVSDETCKKISESMCMHHYIYDFNDLDKYTIPVTRSEHVTIHNNLRVIGLEVPCINILKEV